MSYTGHLQDASTVRARGGIITLSDTRTTANDTSGRTVRDALEAAGHSVDRYELIPDDPHRLDALLNEMLSGDALDLVVTNGGTGISRRDTTIEVVQRHLDQPLPGFGELFRMLSFQQVGSGAMLSRAVGGVARGKLLFALPGSTPAVELAMDRLIVPELKHLLSQMRKGAPDRAS